jgi:hypothetical protein
MVRKKNSNSEDESDNESSEELISKKLTKINQTFKNNFLIIYIMLIA